MAEGRDRNLWDHTASVVWAAIHSFRKPKTKPVDWHPYLSGKSRRGVPLTGDAIRGMKSTFEKLKKRTQKQKPDGKRSGDKSR